VGRVAFSLGFLAMLRSRIHCWSNGAADTFCPPVRDWVLTRSTRGNIRQRGTRTDHSPLAKALLRKADLESVAAEKSTWVDPSLLREIDRLEHSIVDYLRECGHGSMLESALHEARVEAEVSERVPCSRSESGTHHQVDGG
jgi:hypothetical protein